MKPYPDIQEELTTNNWAENTHISIRAVAEIEEGIHADMDVVKATQNGDLENTRNVHLPHITEDDEDSDGHEWGGRCRDH